ncbi:hypothetical protein [Fulvivirga sediminis]|uniref:Uncharacterized protein n=1 Tax=Fulvivirga sediminis TaxID=2803949 RepID=A0A937FCJ9_9BACT|nr:hypothetical protein [Fulvivirga sediminis]MBL3658410.1 hypothetical protein [Fulvivirga sediminis]
MKSGKLIILGLLIMITSHSYGQLSLIGHNIVEPIDVKTATKLGILNGTLGARNGANTGINTLLKALIIQEKLLIKSKYNKTSYDHSSSFIAKSAGTLALSMSEQMMASEFSKGKYMTENKRTYMKNLSLDKAVLPFLQKLDYKNITAESRQEIYRLREQLIKEYLNNDKETLKMLLLPAAAYSTMDEGKLLKMIDLFLLYVLLNDLN